MGADTDALVPSDGVKFNIILTAWATPRLFPRPLNRGLSDGGSPIEPCVLQVHPVDKGKRG